MRGRGMSWHVAALLAAAAVLAALVVVRLSDEAGAWGGLWCARVQAASDERARAVTGSGPRIVVIGDSYAQGSHLAQPEKSWPSRLPGRVHVDGFGGSGFSGDAGRCPGKAFAGRAARALALDPDLVVLEGGLNDYDTSTAALVSGARRALAALGDVPVVVVGPPLAPSRASEVPRVDRALSAVAAEAGVRYVRTTRWPLDLLPDRLHLTVEGHRDFGDRVARAVAPLL